MSGCPSEPVKDAASRRRHAGVGQQALEAGGVERGVAVGGRRRLGAGRRGRGGLDGPQQVAHPLGRHAADAGHQAGQAGIERGRGQDRQLGQDVGLERRPRPPEGEDDHARRRRRDPRQGPADRVAQVAERAVRLEGELVRAHDVGRRDGGAVAEVAAGGERDAPRQAVRGDHRRRGRQVRLGHEPRIQPVQRCLEEALHELRRHVIGGHDEARRVGRHADAEGVDGGRVGGQRRGLDGRRRHRRGAAAGQHEERGEAADEGAAGATRPMGRHEAVSLPRVARRGRRAPGGDQVGQGVSTPVMGRQWRSGWRAAVASSSRRTGAVWGAEWTSSGSSCASAAMASRASAKASSVSTDSVSVGSMSRHSSTMWREIDGRGMEALVDEPLGDVERAHAGRRLERLAAGHELVLAGPVVGDVVGAPEARLQVVGGQHCVLADLDQAAPPWARGCRRRRARSTPTLPWIGAHAADRRGPLVRPLRGGT